jgi:hypothetical protein
MGWGTIILGGGKMLFRKKRTVFKRWRPMAKMHETLVWQGFLHFIKAFAIIK